VQAGDVGQEGVASVAEFLGLQGGEPASLLLIEAAHQEVEMGVPLPLGMILTSLAAGALTLMDRGVRHDETSAAWVTKGRRSL
jgi:hypothetical protein